MAASARLPLINYRGAHELVPWGLGLRVLVCVFLRSDSAWTDSAGRAGMSPGAPGIGLFGIGIVLQNDAYGELRVIDIVSRASAFPPLYLALLPSQGPSQYLSSAYQ